MRLEGTAAIVTGAGSDIGRATALRLASRGCDLAVNDLSAESAQSVVDEIAGHGGSAIAVQGDVSSDADCRAGVDAAAEAFGRLDVLVNNAGYPALVPHDDLDGVTDELWDRTLDVNLNGPFQMVRAAKPALTADGGGEVVNVSSFASVYGTGSSIPYCTSKAGLNLLTVMLARVLGPEVRINAVAPGVHRRPLVAAGLRRRLRRHPRIRRGSDMVTGQVLIVDGSSGISG